ncbi:Tetratricopeptide repeat-containing protein [Bryocella elongata]|uniref:Tetratricopeptide repeat-containing protein n=1 Tax=Bryocella elongata TaxID=863522 RepID=A0A1H6AJQ0_9BACT|nr:tetratricopeptide repeat protein [Bryocella elongata]SEG48632.1 Tetratricopeptide repeat-containing protein [Bryocella elongata]
MRPLRWLSTTFGLSMLVVVALTATVAAAQKPAASTSPEERASLHSGPEWDSIAPHLPDPKTASAAQLELAGDVLRARRFPEDSLDYYEFAVQRGGEVTHLLNKMGIVRLELRQNELARELFLRVVRVNKKNSQAWNNLAVAEFTQSHYGSAIEDYRKAIHYDRRSGVYHANLAMAYFEKKDMEGAQTQLAAALKLDPTIMRAREAGGITAHVVGSRNYPQFCFELARLYARSKRPALAREWLAKASEGGYDVRSEMADDDALRPYLNDPEVKLMLANADELRKRRVAAAGSLPALGSPAAARPQPESN